MFKVSRQPGAKAALCEASSADITNVLKNAGVAIPMGGRGRCMDNVQTLSRTGGVRVLTHRATMAVSQIRGDLRELLFHFIAIGGLIFVFYAAVDDTGEAPADVIVTPERIE